MEDNKSLETTAESAENVETEAKESQEKTFTRDEVNKIVHAEKVKALDEYKAQVEAEKTEAEKLAKMKSDEKLQYQLEKTNKEKEEALAKLNAFELKEEATKIASEKGLEISLLDLIDFKTATAESIDAQINNMLSVFNKAVEKAVNEKLKEDSPISKLENETTKKQRVARSSF